MTAHPLLAPGARTFDPTLPVRTRAGFPVRILCTDRRDPAFPIVALYDDGSGEGVLCATADGYAYELPEDKNGDEPNLCDLVNCGGDKAPPSGAFVISGADVDMEALQKVWHDLSPLAALRPVISVDPHMVVRDKDAQRDAIELLRAFYGIQAPETRRQILNATKVAAAAGRPVACADEVE